MSQIIQWDPTATTLQAWRLWILYTLCQVSRTAHSARASILFQPTMTITAVVFPQQINIWWDLIRYDIIPYRLQAKLLIYILTFLPIDLFTIYFICYWECFPNGHSIDSFAKVDDISTVLKCSEKVTQHDNIQFLNSGHRRDRMHEELEYSSLYKLSQWVVEELLTRIRGLVLLLVLLLAIIMLGILAILWSMIHDDDDHVQISHKYIRFDAYVPNIFVGDRLLSFTPNRRAPPSRVLYFWKGAQI